MENTHHKDRADTGSKMPPAGALATRADKA